jgi:hypothetical protein
MPFLALLERTVDNLLQDGTGMTVRSDQCWAVQNCSFTTCILVLNKLDTLQIPF